MPMFPIFMDLSSKNVLVVGGGKVATRKVKSLTEFTRNITVVSPKITKELKRLIKEKGLRFKRRKFLRSDLKGKDIVIVAVEDLNLQRDIFNICSKKGILCNTVDTPQYCSFIFPSLIVKGDLVIGISTSGKVPALSRRLREKIEKTLPSDLEETLKTLYEIRSSMEKGIRRRSLLLKLSEAYLK